MVNENKSYIVDPNDAFKKAVAEASKSISDLTLPYTLMTREWFKSNRSIFDMGRKGPGKYPPLGGPNPDQARRTDVQNIRGKRVGTTLTNREYAEQRKIQMVGFAYPLLVFSGALASSMTVPGDSGSVASIINKKILILGTKVVSKKGFPYPIALQTGAKKGGKIMFLPRPFVLIGSEQVAPSPINKRQEIWANHLKTYVASQLTRFAEGKK